MHYNLIKASNRRYLEELKNKFHEFENVVKSVNILQQTEWVINEDIYQVIKKCVENNFTLGKLPLNPDLIDLPPKPLDIATNTEAKTKWKRMAHQVYTDRNKQKSKHIQVKQIFTEATEMRKTKGFFYPLQLDFRTRIYAKPAMLTMQSADYSKALIKFKYGKRMQTDDAFVNFAIAGANLFGEVDKESLKTRVDWVQKYEAQIISTAKSPFEDTWWTLADKPYQFLAWCFEYKAFAETDYDPDFITTLPIQSDCSNSGLQHYSAMMRDEVGGLATNLIPLDKPNDVYALVALKVIEKLKTRSEPLATLWLEYGIDRKLCKKPVMCLPYSLTRYSCRAYLAEHVVRQLNERGVTHKFGDDLFKATNYLTPIVWDSINEVIVGAKQIMKYLKDISSLVSSENLPVSWVTPLGFPVMMACYKTESQRVKTKMGDSILKLSYQTNTNLIDKRQTSQSICPNFIHSLDASVLQLAVVKAHQQGVDSFCMIHDSFGVTAPDVNTMANAVRDSFCEIYQQDVLKNFADDMFKMLSHKNQKKFPKLPQKGNLNLDDVKNSKFFCI